MALRFTVQHFPADKELRDNTGLPWGCTVQPFATSEDTQEILSAAPLTSADDVARCEECYAYINAYCALERLGWRCTLCDAKNSWPSHLQSRYGNKSRLAECAELASSLVDLDVAVEENAASNAASDLYSRPVYVALVDLSSSEEFLELVKSALLAALEALTPGSLFGLATFGRKVGLYDVQGDIPIVKQVTIPSEDDPLPLPLPSVMHLEAFLAPIDHEKEHVAAALESLKPAPEPQSRSEGQDEEAPGGRGFGAALEAILGYLGGEEGRNSFVSARVFGFLSGPPDLGLGKVDLARNQTPNSAFLPDQNSFYKDLAAQAVQSGISVDLCVVTPDFCDLASLKALCIESGGGLALYPNPEEATLPQDLYRQLSRPRATSAILRLRCSPEFQVVRAYGSLFPDAQYEDVYHIISCHPADTFAFDLEFNSHNGFSRNVDQAPMVQLAFQYTILIPVEEGWGEGAGAGGGERRGGEIGANGGAPAVRGTRYVLRRRLRVRTVRLEVARSQKQVFETADYETILAILTHKIIFASYEEGIQEGRLLLIDWLVILTANYNDYFKLAQFHQPSSLPQLDVGFALCPPLQTLTRVVFALLRSPLLRMEEGMNPDARVYLQCLYSTLEPSYLIRAIYPVLSSYASPNQLAYPRHSLSRAALVTSGSPIFLLDAYSTLIVYYSPLAPTDLPFPPPHNSLLRNTINKLKVERNITPRLVMIRGGVENAEPFERFLLEEQDVDGTSDNVGTGFVTFLEEIAVAVRRFMKFE